jgi:hypothetical protein
MQFTRWLRNPKVTVAEMAAQAAARTAERVLGRDIVVIQDTSELVLGGKRARANGFGPVGKGGALGGLLLHAVLAAEAGSGAVLGLADMAIWNRAGGKVTARRGRKLAEKESQRWVDTGTRTGELLASAASITVLSDREGDIYEQFVCCPANVHLIVRACQNRGIETGEPHQSSLLFDFIDGLPEQARFMVTIPAAPGRKERMTELALRFSPVVVRKPLHGVGRKLPKSVALHIVDVREISQPRDGELLHWRLLTTHGVTTVAEARRIVDLYRQRWTIEEFFHTLKTGGFNIEDADIGDPGAMTNFVGAATVSAVTVMQLVRARDGATDQTLTDVFEPEDQPIIEAISEKLEGKTARQKNPHPRGSLAFATWALARLGGWSGYYGKPGPLVIRRGLADFQRIKYGVSLGLRDV